jgi:protein SCO1/2
MDKLTDEEQAKVQFVLLSVDPGHDTPEVLRNYVQKFHPGIRAATGAEDQLKKIASAFHAGFAKEQENPQDIDIYMMAHSPKYYLVNPRGEWQVVYDPPLKRGDLVSDLRQFLKQQSGEPMLW